MDIFAELAYEELKQKQNLPLDEKIKYAIRIYNLYGDERADILESVKRKITFIPIEDVDQL